MKHARPLGSYSTPNASKTLPALPPHSPYPELT